MVVRNAIYRLRNQQYATTLIRRLETKQYTSTNIDMGILGNIIEREQLGIRDCYDIFLDEWRSRLTQPVINSMKESTLKELEKRYEDTDPMRPEIFESICSDIPELICDHLYHMGHITAALKDNLLCEMQRCAPYWGVPESPSFLVPIRTYPGVGDTYFHTNIINLIWEKQWKGVDPVAYDKFIRHMHLYWHSNMGFGCNPDPWKTLQDVINNPQDYEYLM